MATTCDRRFHEPTEATCFKCNSRRRPGQCEPFCKLHVHCPACNGRRLHSFTLATWAGLKSCRRCGALFGQCYRGDSPVKTWAFDKAPHVEGRDRYFDLTLVGTIIERVHGWFNPETGYVTQLG